MLTGVFAVGGLYVALFLVSLPQMHRPPRIQKLGRLQLTNVPIPVKQLSLPTA